MSGGDAASTASLNCGLRIADSKSAINPQSAIRNPHCGIRITMFE